MNILYVSDLDGTLLRSNQTTSEYTNRIINELVEKGMLFSYATARSYNTSHKATRGMTAAFPIIVYNGAFIKDNATEKMLLKNFFNKNEAVNLIEEMISKDISPVIYAFVEGAERFSYISEKINSATREFIESRKGDSRDRPIKDVHELSNGDIFYITCIDRPDKLKPLYEKYKEIYHCVYQRDIYSNEQWLEIMPQKASKANAVRQLADLLGCDYIIVFGDGINDIDMFEMADEAYAVENAVPELKEIATAVIDSNDNDGVAKWLYQRYRNSLLKNE